MLSERTQVLLSPAQRRRVERLAEERGLSVGAVIREAIDHHLPARTRSRGEALSAIKGLRLPVDDWSRLEEEIIRGATR